VILKPWPFQVECKDAIWSAIAEGYQRFIGGVLPTGSGKTVVFSWLAYEARAKGFRVLILVERDELVNQTVRKLHSVAPDLIIGVYRGARKELHGDITVASKQTLCLPANLEKISPDRWNFIIVDECHHAAAEGYQRILKYFGGWRFKRSIVPVDFDCIRRRSSHIRHRVHGNPFP
jgi:superfamily II DNA or RNA helicase